MSASKLGLLDPLEQGDMAGDQVVAPAPLMMPGRAYFDWREFNPAIHFPQGTPLAEELATYGAHLIDLLTHEGQYVLIKGQEIIGIFPSRRAGLDEAVNRFGGDPAMVKQIIALEPIEFIRHAEF